jgi:mannose/fructose/N-acetylgalactosamine-specific phosphotransferase system component IID
VSTAYPLGTITGLRFSARPSAFIGALLLWIILSGVGIVALKLSPVEAILGGLVATLLHYLSDAVHQLGHAWAARRTGYPMTGVQFWWVLSSSLYPPDEPELPATTHIYRALGGPTASFLLAVIAGGIVLALASTGGVVLGVALFFFLDNLLVLCLGAFLPLGFNDGSTLLRWLPRR